MRELTFIKTGRLEWRERPAPVITAPTDALVRPFIASRCDGDTLPLHSHVSRPMQAGLKLGKIDPVISGIVGDVPFRGRGRSGTRPLPRSPRSVPRSTTWPSATSWWFRGRWPAVPATNAGSA